MTNDKWKMDSPDPTPHLERFGSYEQACRDFRWRIPRRLNIANEICRRHADAVTRVALSDVKEGGINTYTFGGLGFLSDKFATGLTSSGIRQGDSVAVVLPPSAALAVAHLGALKAGAVVVPISITAGDELLQHALSHSSAKALVVDERIYGAFESFSIPDVASRFVVRDLRPSDANLEAKDFWSEVERASSGFDAVDTDSNSAAFTFYIESQDHIDGIVHSHRSVIGQLAAFEKFNNVAAESEAVFWTADNWTAPATVLGISTRHGGTAVRWLPAPPRTEHTWYITWSNVKSLMSSFKHHCRRLSSSLNHARAKALTRKSELLWPKQRARRTFW
jgi:acetyl-CoA synthetase